MQPEQLAKQVKKIAVLRANALGDFIVTLPALFAIKQTYPNAELILLGRPWHKEFLQDGRSPVNRVIIVPISTHIREEANQAENPAKLQEFFQQMREERFDIAIHLQGNGISANPFIKNLGAKLTVGLSCAQSEKIDLAIPYLYYQSEVFRFLEVVSLIGAQTDQLEPKVNILPEDITEVIKIFSPVQPYVVIHPGANDLRRCWSPDKFAKVADEMISQGLRVVITGIKAEEKVVEKMVSYMSKQPTNLCSKLSLGGLSGLLSQASLVISNDTGTLHLAGAVGAKTVGLYWLPNVINWGPLTRRNHRPVISLSLNCQICGIVPASPWPFEPQTDCKHEASFVESISVEEVLEQAWDLLGREDMAN